MIRPAILAVVAFLIVPALPASGQQATAKTPRVINITTDSAPGWLPSEELDVEADAFLRNYFGAYDRGDDPKLWGMTGDGFRSLSTYAQFRTDNKRTRQDLGHMRTLEVLRATWTKDPANAPEPGIYVAIDISGHFTKAQRHCGYVVLFKSSASNPFRLTRIETNYMTDAAARTFAKRKLPGELDRVWSTVSANCPNYPKQPIAVY